jgi:hypothetical protein
MVKRWFFSFIVQFIGIFTRSIFCQGKAKIIEKAQFTIVNELFENIFNAAMAKKTNCKKVYRSFTIQSIKKS